MSDINIRSMIDDALCLGIIHGALAPLDYAYAKGYNDHADGLAFHECTYDYISPAALSWRIGWNDRALKEK